MIDYLLSFIAPHHCYNCGESGSILCNGCYDDINDDDFGRCIWCLRPANESHQCRSCAQKYGVTAVWTVGERRGVLKKLVGDFKYESVRATAPLLAELLDGRIAQLPMDTIVTAVPTVNRHIRQRGFDHAALLARQLARQRKCIYTPLLKRQHQTAQHELERAARLRVAQSAFDSNTSLSGGTVLLVDDIITTGATLQACTRLLRAAGAERVFIAVVARQMPT